MLSILSMIGIIIGIVAGIITIIELLIHVLPLRKFSWRVAERVAKKIANRLVRDNYLPTLIVGIGRGGAIMGSLISGCLGHRPLLVIDRDYKWKNGQRFDDIIFKPEIPRQFLERVLLISGEVHTGNTMRLYYEYFKSMNAKEIRKATFFYEKGASVKVEYKGIESSRKNLLMPWMISKNYLRSDRGS